MKKQEDKIPSVVIDKIIFNDDSEFEFNRDDIVLLVGSNNVGKSKTLKELKMDLQENYDNRIMIKGVQYSTENFSANNIREYCKKNLNKDSSGNYYAVMGKNERYSVYLERLKEENMTKSNFYRLFYTFLSTENRLNLTSPIRFNYTIDDESWNIMSKLDNDIEAITVLNTALNQEFKQGVDVYEECIDGNLIKKYKIGKCEEIEKTINANKREAKVLLHKLKDLYDQGDGIRSATAILASLIVDDKSLVFLDEPETFLHPPQARALGKDLVKLSREKQCFVSTHNIDFIKGVLEEDASRVKIIKIDRNENDNVFHLIDNDTISGISNDKNLKYTNILDGIFYDRLVLCENESDCKFYSAILEHLNLDIFQTTLFCAVGGKYQFKKVIPLLKKISINFKVIADIDLINNSQELNQLLNSVEDDCYNEIGGVHSKFLETFEEQMYSLVKTQETIKNEINELFTEDKYILTKTVDRIKETLKNVSSFKCIKQGGISMLPQGECEALFEQINQFLIERSIFILTCGEIERLVRGSKGHGDLWVENTFNKYPDIEDGVYDEAKAFIKKVFDIEGEK